MGRASSFVTTSNAERISRIRLIFTRDVQDELVDGSRSEVELGSDASRLDSQELAKEQANQLLRIYSKR